MRTHARTHAPAASRAVITALATVAAAAAFARGTPARAQDAGADPCDRYGCGTARDATGNVVCFTPARPAPQALWGALAPTDPDPLPRERDTTDFNEFMQSYWSRHWFMSVETQNGYVIAGLAHGVAVFDARTDPAHPTLMGARLYGPGSAFPFIPGGESSKIPFGGVASPEGNDNVAALAGYNGAGLLVFDLRIKQGPNPVYQDVGNSGDGVYAVSIAGRNYAFFAAGLGLFAYDLDAAMASNGCIEGGDVDAGGCPGVRLGQLPASGSANYVHGVDHYVVAGGFNGITVYDVTDPSAARVILQDATSTAGRPVGGVAMWKQGGAYYIAARLGNTISNAHHDLAVFDASCLASGCTTLGTALSQHEYDSAGGAEYLSFARSGATPFLFVGSDASCLGNDGRQHTWLLNMSDPRNPVDVTPQQTVDETAPYQGVATTVAVNYWSWSERGSPTGFYLVAPRAGAFVGEYFYRAGRSVLDVHHWTPPVVSVDAGGVDAGADAGIPTDAGSRDGAAHDRDVVLYDSPLADFDGGGGGGRAGGCGCRAGGEHPAGYAWSLTLGGAVVTAVGSRRRRRRAL